MGTRVLDPLSSTVCRVLPASSGSAPDLALLCCAARIPLPCNSRLPLRFPSWKKPMNPSAEEHVWQMLSSGRRQPCWTFCCILSCISLVSSCSAALDMAVALRQPPEGCIHHTDRGSQYCSHDYQKCLLKNGFKVSMSGKGNCYDNSMVETFFKSIKAELIWRNRWDTRRQAEGAIFQYINGFYNSRRRHSSLGSKSPLAFERKAGT